MSEDKKVTTFFLSKAAKECGISWRDAKDILQKNGKNTKSLSFRSKISSQEYEILLKEYHPEKYKKWLKTKQETVKPPKTPEKIIKPKELKHKKTEYEKLKGTNVVKKINLTKKDTVKKDKKENVIPPKNEQKPQKKNEPPVTQDIHKTKYKKLEGPNVVDKKIDLTKLETRKPRRTKRKRIVKPKTNVQKPKPKPKRKYKAPILKTNEPSEEEIKKQVKEALERLQNTNKKSAGAKFRKEKRELRKKQNQKQLEKKESEKKILKVTEFITASEVATMMNQPITKIISVCMTLGVMVTMNQRLDPETLTIIAEEFGFEVEFTDSELENKNEENAQLDDEKDLKERPPIVTVMGHVDHGKTSLLDYIRSTNVIDLESGGITQHIGAYSVTLENGKKITFLDTPGHQAFTAMRARGTSITDIVIIVIAADDKIMPQTEEAISHAQAASVPIIFAINKVDKESANADKIKEALANKNLLVEDWGGKIQSQDISAKKGIGVLELLEKVILEAELLELKANPNKNASGTVIEAALDKGRGYVTTLLIQGGTLKKEDYILAGKCRGKIRAMFDENGKELKIATPSTPISILGLDGAPSAGDRFQVYEDEKEAKQIANKRNQLQREQSIRTQKHLTLDEIGRRLSVGDFKELNIIIKGDVDGSVEALVGALQKLSTEEIQVNVIHKGVGAITESDVLLAATSEAIIIGFNVRPSGNTKKLAVKEKIDIRTYGVVFEVIDDIKNAMEGMLSPDMKEEILGDVEVREIFKISKIGSIAGCMVMNGKIVRDGKIRLIREGIVLHTGQLESLKRFKDDVKEVAKGYDCGVQIKGYNNIEINDKIEIYKEIAIRKKI